MIRSYQSGKPNAFVWCGPTQPPTMQDGDVWFNSATQTAWIKGNSGLLPLEEGATTVSTEPATFCAVFDRIAPAQNKYLATLFNTSATRKVVIQRLRLLNWQYAPVTGVLIEASMLRITARTAGTVITPLPVDSADTLSVGITADFGSTSVTEAGLWQRAFTGNEETKLGALTLENSVIASELYRKWDGMKGITLRQNQGLSVKQVTNSVVGSVSVVMEFTDEPI